MSRSRSRCPLVFLLCFNEPNKNTDLKGRFTDICFTVAEDALST